MRFGIRAPLAVGLLIGAIGLALFARAPVALASGYQVAFVGGTIFAAAAALLAAELLRPKRQVQTDQVFRRTGTPQAEAWGVPPARSARYSGVACPHRARPLRHTRALPRDIHALKHLIV